MDGQILKPKKRKPSILYTNIFYNTLTFLYLILTKAYFVTGKQILLFVNNAENRGGSRSFIHQITANNGTSKNPEL